MASESIELFLGREEGTGLQLGVCCEVRGTRGEGLGLPLLKFHSERIFPVC